MKRLRLFYRDNKKKIWSVIGIIVFILTLIHLANYNIKKEKEENYKDLNTTENTKNNVSYAPSQSIISNTKISKKSAEENINLIEKFIEYCNNNQVEEAYNLLSNDCKKEIFPTIEDFYKNYHQNIFTEQKSYDAEMWGIYNGVTYKIRILKDIMASGKIEKEFIEDYYTIVTEDENLKLNIKNFVNKVEINKSNSVEDIDFNVLNKKIHIDYEEIEIEIKNNSDKRVVIDTKENTETVFIKDTNGVGYGWYGHEIANNLLELDQEETVSLVIKFNKIYNTNRKDAKLYFTDIHKEGIEKTLDIEIGI